MKSPADDAEHQHDDAGGRTGDDDLEAEEVDRAQVAGLPAIARRCSVLLPWRW